eukprot:11177200-Lingulodinium_polyedra.AAC.1
MPRLLRARQNLAQPAPICGPCSVYRGPNLCSVAPLPGAVPGVALPLVPNPPPLPTVAAFFVLCAAQVAHKTKKAAT